MRSYYHILLIGVFATLLFSGMLGSIFHWDFYGPQDENRRLAEFPIFSETPIESWPNQFESYFDDHFGFRNTFIRRYNRLMRKSKKSNHVFHGEDGWLYYNSSTVMMDFLGNRQPSAEDLQETIYRIESRCNWLKSKNIEYLFILAPNKITLYPEHLPADYRSLGGKTYRETLIESLKDSSLSENFIDLASVLETIKNTHPLYFRTDTHWTPMGSYIGYTNLVSSLQHRFSDIPEALKQSDIQQKPVDYSGDLASMTGTPNRYREHCEKWYYETPKYWSKQTLNLPIFLDPANRPIGDNAPFTIYNPLGTHNALVFHDSFFLNGTIVEWLPTQFKNITFIWRYSNAELLRRTVEFCKPDIVIEEVIERHLVDKKNGAFLDSIHSGSSE